MSTDLSNEQVAELEQLIDGIFDPGCESATRIHNLLPAADSPLYQPAMMIITNHEQHTTNHTHDCYTNQPAN